MKHFHAILLLFAVSTAPAFADAMSDARDILDRYTRADRPAGPSKNDPYDRAMDELVNRARQARALILAEWKAMPAEAVAVAGTFLSDKASPVQRYEIVSALGHNIHTRACAELLHCVLQDVRQPKEEEAAIYEELTRLSAVSGLGQMARTVDHLGRGRTQRGTPFAPQVPGLAPYLVAAAADKSELVRVWALTALADCGDPAAVAEFRRHLEDKSDRVRFHAACLLTEFQDTSGLPRMRDKLGQLRKTDPKTDDNYYRDAELLFAAFERCTGKSMGKTPLDPSLSGSTTGAAVTAQEYQTLLNAWDAWWKTANSVR